MENQSVAYKEKVDVINRVIEFIREKGVKPSCKLLPEETVFTDLTTAADDVTMMDLARGIANTKMPADEFVKQWRNQYDNEIRHRNKLKQKEWGGYLLPPPREPKNPKTSLVISLTMNQTCQK